MFPRAMAVRTELLVFALLILCPRAEVAAGEHTPHQGTSKRGHFGAPVVKYTLVGDQGAVMVGGRGGWGVSTSLLVGFGAFGTITEVDAPKGAMPDSLGPMDLKFESFGLDLEYAAKPGAPTHLTLGLFVGGAAAHYLQERTGEQYGETDFLLLLEPAVGVERRVIDWFRVNLSASYRLVSGAEQPGLENGDINGPSAALALKFGRF